MALTSDRLASMLAQINLGIPKDESPFVTDEESGAAWDAIVAEVEEMRADGTAIDVPGEIYGA